MSRKVFYVVYFQDQRLQSILDAIRFIANPEEKTPAHITLRGPYSQVYNTRKLSEKIAGSEGFTYGAEAFFYETQNTVYFRCESENFWRVWNKKHYGFNPHITIYNGPSRIFAERLLSLLKQFSIRFQFVVGELQPMVSYKGQNSTFLREAFDEEISREIVGKKLTIKDIDNMPLDNRISTIRLFCRELERRDGLKATAPSVAEFNLNLFDTLNSDEEEDQYVKQVISL